MLLSQGFKEVGGKIAGDIVCALISENINNVMVYMIQSVFRVTRTSRYSWSADHHIPMR